VEPERLPPTAAILEGRTGRIEIVLPTGARVQVDDAVSEQALLRVLRALKGSI
jgi:hypothetical protein